MLRVVADRAGQNSLPLEHEVFYVKNIFPSLLSPAKFKRAMILLIGIARANCSVRFPCFNYFPVDDEEMEI
jgi:hypothetical protein